jgi:hypothetical protein
MLIAAAATAALLGALAAWAIPSGGAHRMVAERIPPVEVRTEVIRKTINVYRRDHPHVAGAAPGVQRSSGGSRSAGARTAGATTTRSSGVAGARPHPEAAVPVRARSSGVTTRPARRPATGAPAPRTRTSGAARTPGASRSKPTRTRTSGGHGDDGAGEHDD